MTRRRKPAKRTTRYVILTGTAGVLVRRTRAEARKLVQRLAKRGCTVICDREVETAHSWSSTRLYRNHPNPDYRLNDLRA